MLLNVEKHITLPGTLKNNTLYFIKNGSYFDMLLSNSSGTAITYPVRNSLLTGDSGGQMVIGGTAAGDGLVFTSNSQATVANKGKIYFGAAKTSVYDEVNDRLGIGTPAPTHSLTLPSTTSGFALYSSTDQLVNYSRLRIFYQAAGFTIASEKAGTETAKNILISGQIALNGNIVLQTSGFSIGSNIPLTNIYNYRNVVATQTLSGTIITGSIEQNGTHFYGTIGTTRYQLDQQASQSKGQSTQNGNGATTAFTITHGLTGITSASQVFITPRSAAALNPGLISLSATQITINYPVAPASGTNNLIWDWYIIP